MALQVGDKAPAVLGVNQDGKEIKLTDFTGKKVVLYFYPKDSTPGCTAQACSLRDNYDELIKAGYEVIGVSADSASSHQKFIAKQNLPFNLIADTDKVLSEKMGTWGEKSMYGRLYMSTLITNTTSNESQVKMGMNRTTFIINAYGIIEKIFYPKDINTKSHAKQILE
jgi:peroxiredoxin Q/BCP